MASICGHLSSKDYKVKHKKKLFFYLCKLVYLFYPSLSPLTYACCMDGRLLMQTKEVWWLKWKALRGLFHFHRYHRLALLTFMD